MFLAKKWHIEIDYNSSVFQGFGFTADKYERNGTTKTSNTILKPVHQVIDRSVVWQNTITNEYPAVIHFNADGKSSGMFRKVSRTLFKSENKSIVKKIKQICKVFHIVYREEI